MTCAECKASRPPETVPYLVHESALARAERTAKRLWITVLILIFLLVGSNAGWLVHESQFEEKSVSYEASTDGGGNAIANGEGSVYYGTGESND